MINKEEIELKNKKVDEVTIELKKRFVGIDEQIDMIMNNLRAWYLFPELQSRPLVISLWGLSGSGKTHLVKTLAKLLDIEQDMVYWNFAEIGEASTWEIESEIEEQLENERSNRMFVYDEFQYAATLNSKGEEKDNRGALKTFWELLDSGILHKKNMRASTKQIFNIMFYLDMINRRTPILIKNGQWENAGECMETFSPYEVKKFSEIFNLPNNKMGEEECGFFIRDEYVERIIHMYNYSVKAITDKLSFYNKLVSMNYDEFMDFVKEIYYSSCKGYDLNFSDSVIFVIGNLDEAYEVAFNVDPDMSPDRFHKITKKINVVDIKKALQERFRNEQIARLGNIHVIYPAFSKDTFKKIITMNLEEYAANAKQQSGIDLKFDKSLHTAIYKEAVFPTHGTRPIFSTIHELVKTKLPIVLAEAINNQIELKSITYFFKNKHVILECFDERGNKIMTKRFAEKMRLDSLRESTKDEEQSLVALHESGHFVIYSCLFGKLPEKLCSKTATSGTGGFLMKDFDDSKGIYSKTQLLNEIKVLLGGYVAERYIFGNDMQTTGASSDLREATKIASNIIRNFGMGGDCAVRTYVEDIGINEMGQMLKDDNDRQSKINNSIVDILLQCEAAAKQILSDTDWLRMLKKSALWLSEHSNMSRTKMKEFYEEVPLEKREKYVINDTYYKTKIQEI